MFCYIKCLFFLNSPLEKTIQTVLKQLLWYLLVSSVLICISLMITLSGLLPLRKHNRNKNNSVVVAARGSWSQYASWSRGCLLSQPTRCEVAAGGAQTASPEARIPVFPSCWSWCHPSSWQSDPCSYQLAGPARSSLVCVHTGQRAHTCRRQFAIRSMRS